MTRTVDTASLEQAIIRNCSPTLAALKPASLFTFPGTFNGQEGRREREQLKAALDACRAQLADYGIRIRLLSWNRCGALIYIYRPVQLEEYQSDPRARRSLQQAGYQGGLEERLDRLSARMQQDGIRHRCPCDSASRCEREFPHEMGYFLGYPYEDVAEFIRQRGKNYLAVGLWKVYSDEEQAQRMFAQFKRCSRAMMRAYQRHGRLEGLAACA